MKIVDKKVLQALELATSRDKDETSEYCNSVKFSNDNMLATDSKLMLVASYSHYSADDYPSLGDVDTTKPFGSSVVNVDMVRKLIKNMGPFKSLPILDNTSAVYVDGDDIHGVVTDLKNNIDIKSRCVGTEYPDTQSIEDMLEDDSLEKIETNLSVQVLERAIKIAKLISSDKITLTTYKDKPISKIEPAEGGSTLYITSCRRN